MKKLIFLLLATIVALSACTPSKKAGFTINGNFKNLKDSFVYLRWRTDKDSIVIDSAAVKNGQFAFKGKTANPEMVILFGSNRKYYLRFFLENSAIRISGNVDSFHQAAVTGSKSQEELESYQSSVKNINQQEEQLYSKYKTAIASKDAAAKLGIENQINGLDSQRNILTKKFISDHPKSFVSLAELNQLAYSTPYAELNKLFLGLDATVRNASSGKAFAKRLKLMAKTAIGQQAPDFTLNDVNGHPVSLSDFRGKYVLVDFWASWCGPCRAENPNVVKAYNLYKDKNFTVLGVSLDMDTANWLKAIKQDQLTWTQVSDLKGWKNKVAQEYGIKAIPTNYLLDTAGTIIGHNLRGEALEKKLATTLR